MTTSTLHDPVPDGKTGPWLRERHARDAHGYVTDLRCERCRQDIQDERDELAWDRYAEWVAMGRPDTV